MARVQSSLQHQPHRQTSTYFYQEAGTSHTHDYLWNPIVKLLNGMPPPADVFEIGCGNGSTAGSLAELGYTVTGVDPSHDGIRIARETWAKCNFELGSAYDNLAETYGRFDIVLSLEVIEHLFSPREFAATVANLLRPGGIAIVSTPYHGYLKNLALAVTNKWDDHLTPLWDMGHIKFWSFRTISLLFSEVGLVTVAKVRAGRIPQLAKSMIVVLKREHR